MISSLLQFVLLDELVVGLCLDRIGKHSARMAARNRQTAAVHSLQFLARV